MGEEGILENEGNGLGDNTYYCSIIPPGNVMCPQCHVSQIM